MLLSAPEALAIRDALLALNNVGGKLDVSLSGKRVREDSEGRVEVYECVPAGENRYGATEFYIDQDDFLAAYNIR